MLQNFHSRSASVCLSLSYRFFSGKNHQNMSDKWRHWRLFGKGLELCANVGTHSEFRSSNAVVRPGSGVRQRGTGGNEGVAWRGWRGNAASNQFPQCWQIIILFSRFGKSRDLYHDQISIFCLFYLFSLEFIQPITETATIYQFNGLFQAIIWSQRAGDTHGSYGCCHFTPFYGLFR